MLPSLSIGPRKLLNDCNHSATAIFWRSAITCSIVTFPSRSPQAYKHHCDRNMVTDRHKKSGQMRRIGSNEAVRRMDTRPVQRRLAAELTRSDKCATIGRFVRPRFLAAAVVC